AGPALTAGTSTIEWIAISPDGRTLAAGGDDTRVTIWDLSGTPVLDATLPPAENYVYSLAFTPDGHTLAIGTVGGAVHLWNIADPRHPSRLGRPTAVSAAYVYCVAFSPDGRTLAVGSGDKHVRLYDVTDPHIPTLIGAPLSGPTNNVGSVAFAPDGRTLAAGSDDHTVWLYDLTNRAHPAALATLDSAPGRVIALAWNQDGTVLAAGAEGQLRLWDFDPESVARAICASAGDPITGPEWNLYVPGSAYRPPCRAAW
ncbi:MAG TPA: hypothetical protein VI248_09585, partial [Kineosporiaceae bacterium]